MRPRPSECALFYVSRDTLFGSISPRVRGSPAAHDGALRCEPLQEPAERPAVLSDAPAHHLFVLLPPIKDDETHLQEPLVVLQAAL